MLTKKSLFELAELRQKLIQHLVLFYGERFQSLVNEGKFLVFLARNLKETVRTGVIMPIMVALRAKSVFASYRLRVAEVKRDLSYK